MIRLRAGFQTRDAQHETRGKSWMGLTKRHSRRVPIGHVISSILVATVIVTITAAGENRFPDLVEGKWSSSGPRTILGQGTDSTISLERHDGGWTLTSQVAHHPSVNDDDQNIELVTEGPFPVTVSKGILAIQRPDRRVHYTYKLTVNSLVMPAIIQQEPGVWIYRSDRDSLRIRCEHDPFEIPIGRAEFAGVLKGRGFYAYEEAPRSRFWPSAQYLRFLERTDAGYLLERFRLIFDAYGSPRYEQILSSGERSHDEYPIRVYLASSPPALSAPDPRNIWNELTKRDTRNR